jgi:hypothetical protein
LYDNLNHKNWFANLDKLKIHKDENYNSIIIGNDTYTFDITKRGTDIQFDKVYGNNYSTKAVLKTDENNDKTYYFICFEYVASGHILDKVKLVSEYINSFDLSFLKKPIEEEEEKKKDDFKKEEQQSELSSSSYFVSCDWDAQSEDKCMELMSQYLNVPSPTTIEYETESKYKREEAELERAIQESMRTYEEENARRQAYADAEEQRRLQSERDKKEKEEMERMRREKRALKQKLKAEEDVRKRELLETLERAKEVKINEIVEAGKKVGLKFNKERLKNNKIFIKALKELMKKNPKFRLGISNESIQDIIRK